MARNVIAIYSDPARADAAIADLLREGVSEDRICLMSHDATQRYRELATLTDEERRQKAVRGLGGGALLGAATGALIALGVAFVPGFWIIGAGPLASILGGTGIGAAAGAAAGGIGGALDRLGIPPTESGRYEAAMRRGGTLVAVRSEEPEAPRVAATLERHGPLDMDRSARDWGRAPRRPAPVRHLETSELEHVPGPLVRSYPEPEEPEPV